MVVLVVVELVLLHVTADDGRRSRHEVDRSGHDEGKRELHGDGCWMVLLPVFKVDPFKVDPVMRSGGPVMSLGSQEQANGGRVRIMASL